MSSNAYSVDSIGKIDYSRFSLSSKTEENMKLLAEIFFDDGTARFRTIENQKNPSVKCGMVFLDGMVNAMLINEGIVSPITNADIRTSGDLIEEIEKKVVQGNEITKSGDVKKLVESILYGDTVIVADGSREALIINSKGFMIRSVSEPDDEKTLRGPREGFTEAILINTSLLRRKLQTSDLKFKFQTVGNRTNTKACICYLDSLVNKEVLAELESRLQKINIDGVLSTNYIEELIKDSKFSLFKTIGSTEKPDIVAAKLLEGRIAVFLDGTPIVLTLPYLFIESFQSTDDYYINFYYGSIGRILRILGFFITISVPAIYVALVAFHREMIPTGIMISIASASKGVPFPIVVETIGMLLVFEILRETGIRMPNKIGQALSIVGALVVGQAAVEAKIVSATTIIIVALTGITGLMNPRMKGAIIILRFGMILAASMIGLYGYFFSMLLLFIYLMSVRSFGIEYTSQIFSYKPQEVKDIFIRAPFHFFRTRPLYLSSDQNRRRSE